MTTIDLKRARELAEMMDRCNCQGINQHEAAFLIRSLCEIVEKLPHTLDGKYPTPNAPLWYIYRVNDTTSYVDLAQPGEDVRFCYADKETAQSALAAAGKEKDAPKCTLCEGCGYIGDPHHGHSVRWNWEGDPMTEFAHEVKELIGAENTTWLIERSQPEGQSPPMWWCGKSLNEMEWTTDAAKAKWFPTKEACDRELESLSGIKGVHGQFGHSTEHMFVGRETKNDVFAKHLDYASRTVRLWPAWKQELLGGKAKSPIALEWKRAESPYVLFAKSRWHDEGAPLFYFVRQLRSGKFALTFEGGQITVSSKLATIFDRAEQAEPKGIQDQFTRRKP